MPEEIVMVSTCPLCAGPEEVSSMVTVEIDRIIPRGRVAIVICRSCAGAVIRAVRKLDPPLLSTEFWINEVKADAPPAGGFTEILPCPANCDLEKSGVPHFHTPKEAKERDDDPSTN